MEGSLVYKYVIVLLVVLLSSCAPMPGNTLFKSMKEPTKISEIEDFKEIPQGFWKTNASCYANGFKHKPVMATISLLLGAPILGCSSIRVREGKVVKCHIYYPKGDEYIRQHELRHCMGYKDVLY